MPCIHEADLLVRCPRCQFVFPVKDPDSKTECPFCRRDFPTYENLLTQPQQSHATFGRELYLHAQR